MVEERAEEGSTLGMEAAQLQSEEDGADGREIPEDYQGRVKK